MHVCLCGHTINKHCPSANTDVSARVLNTKTRVWIQTENHHACTNEHQTRLFSSIFGHGGGVVSFGRNYNVSVYSIHPIIQLTSHFSPCHHRRSSNSTIWSTNRSSCRRCLQPLFPLVPVPPRQLIPPTVVVVVAAWCHCLSLWFGLWRRCLEVQVAVRK